MEPSAPRATAPCPAARVPELGCPRRARTGCPGRPHPPPGALWGSVSEGSRWGRERVGHKMGLSPRLAKARRRPGCSRGCRDAWDRGGAATVCPPGPRPGVAAPLGPEVGTARRRAPRSAREARRASLSPLRPWQLPPPLPVTLSFPPQSDLTSETRFSTPGLLAGFLPKSAVSARRGEPRSTNRFSGCRFAQQSAKRQKTSPFLVYCFTFKI